MPTAPASAPTRRTASARIRACGQAAFSTMETPVAVLEVKALPADLGRRACGFHEHEDEPLLGQAKRAAFEFEGVTLYLELYRCTADGTMTVFVDHAACVRRAKSPLALAQRALAALGLDECPRTFVHTAAEQLFWLQVDPHAVAVQL